MIINICGNLHGISDQDMEKIMHKIKISIINKVQDISHGKESLEKDQNILLADILTKNNSESTYSLNEIEFHLPSLKPSGKLDSDYNDASLTTRKPTSLDVFQIIHLPAFSSSSLKEIKNLQFTYKLTYGFILFVENALVFSLFF